MLIRSLRTGAFLAVALLLHGTAQAEPQSITAKLVWKPGLIGGYTPGKIPFRDTPPSGVKPMTGVATPRYSRINMADTKGLTVLLDAQPESPRLWVDSDFDGDLRDEKRIWLKKTGKTYSRTQPVLIRYEGDAEPTSVELNFRYVPSSGIDYVQVWANAHKRGTVVLGGRLRLVALVDGHADLRFDNPKKDQLYVDLNGDGSFAASDGERITFGAPFRAGIEGWIAKTPDRAGRAIRFERASTVPPPRPRSWPKPYAPKPGVTHTPPSASFEALHKKFKSEKNKTYSDRYRTVQQIGYVGTREAFDFVVRVAKKDKDKNLRMAAVRATGNKPYLSFGGDEVMAWTRASDPGVQNAAAKALHDMGHPEREAAYLRLLGTGDSSLSMSNAARYLTMVNAEGAREPILAAYGRTKTAKNKYTLYVNGLRMLSSGPPVQHMLDAAVSSYAPLQGAGLTDLDVVGHSKALELALKIATVRPVVLQSGIAVAKVLGAIGGAKPVAALLGLFDDPKLHANVRKMVTEQLRFLRDGESMGALVLSLKSKSTAVRSMAAEILAAVPQPAISAAILRRAKREKDPATLAALLQALGDHGDPSAIGLLLKYAKRRRSKDDTKDMARRAAIRSLARIGFDDAKVRKFMLGLLESRSDVNRMLALNAAGASGDARLVPRVAKSLGHGTWQVRLTAINALGRIRAKTCIPLLIAALEREEEYRLREALAQALFRLTGQNLYDNAKIWKNWWSKNKATFVIPAREPEMPEEHAGPSRAGFYGIPIRTRRVTFVIDQSGSMSAAGDIGSNSDKDDDLNRLDVAVREVLPVV